MAKMHRLLRLLAVSALMFGATAFATDAAAQSSPDDYGDTIHVVQPKPVLQQGRIGVTPRLGMTINDALHRNYKIGGQVNYFVTEQFYVGGLAQWFDFGGLIGGETRTHQDVIGETNASVDAPYLNWAAGAELGFVPLYGKFSLFNQGIIFYNISIGAGGGWTDSSSIASPGSQGGPGGTVSLGGQFFLNDWVGVDVELRDVIYSGNVQGQGDVLSHSVTLGLGVSFMFPRGFDYEEAQTL